MTLTPEEIKQIEQEAKGKYSHPFTDEDLQSNDEEYIKQIRWAITITQLLRRGYNDAATKYLLQLKSERERSAKLLEALEEINDPISAMQKRLQDGESLNGLYAVQLSESANYLKGIARTAINEYNNKP